MFINLKSIKIYLPLIILLLIASLEFFLLLRHKSPYLSDSYFYNHIYYEIQGYSYQEAHDKVLNKIDKIKLNDVEKNIFYNPDKYQYSLSRYLRRPLYPYSAYILNLILKNEYLAFILPVFLSYLGFIIFTYIFIKNRLDKFWASFGTGLFIAFYPYIDWSTYFLTDTIGAFFWFLQLYLMLIFIKNPKKNILFVYLFVLVISIFNREQSLLMFTIALFVIIFNNFFKINKNIQKPLKLIFFSSLLITIIFLVINKILKQPSLYDSWIYLQSGFGYYNAEYSFHETASFLIHELKSLHLGLIMELIRHRWWATFTLLGITGIIYVFILSKKPKILDIIILASSISAYIGLIIIPFLSYRYFYPTIVGIIYFAMIALRFVFAKNKINI